MNERKTKNYLNGIKTIRMAFSWTCQPNINDVQAHIAIDFMNWRCVDCLKIQIFLLHCMWNNSNNFSHRMYLSYSAITNLPMHGKTAASVSTNVVIGLIDGKMRWSNSWTNPPVFIPLTLFCMRSTFDAALSMILYRVQKLGAQYAWHSPRLNGNSLAMTCSYKKEKEKSKYFFKKTRPWSRDVLEL